MLEKILQEIEDLTVHSAWPNMNLIEKEKVERIICEYISKEGWVSATERLPEKDMRVQALIKHHKWIADYDSDWVPDEEKTVYQERLETCEAIYKNGEFTFRDMEDDIFPNTAYVTPEENIAAPVKEILMWRPFECAKDNWIPVKNGNPEIYRDEYGELILFLASAENEEMAFRAVYDGKNWGDGWSKIDVTAWQPLPEPYRPDPVSMESPGGDAE